MIFRTSLIQFNNNGDYEPDDSSPSPVVAEVLGYDGCYDRICPHGYSHTFIWYQQTKRV